MTILRPRTLRLPLSLRGALTFARFLRDALGVSVGRWATAATLGLLMGPGCSSGKPSPSVSHSPLDCVAA